MLPRIIIKKAKKEYIKEIDKEVVVSKQKKYFVKEPSKDFQTIYGIISKKDLEAKDGSKILTDQKKEFFIFSPDFIDFFKRLTRLPQTIPLKDIGLIIAECGLGKKSIVIDAGTGSGAVACFLGNACKKVVSYEIKKEHYEIAQKNVKELGLKNVELKNKNAYLGFDEKNADAVILDLPSPWEAIKSAENALKVGGFVVSYSPTIPQTMDFVSGVNKNSNFLIEKVIELVEREWQVEDRKVRPKSKSSIHSGFLAFARKIGL